MACCTCRPNRGTDTVQTVSVLFVTCLKHGTVNLGLVKSCRVSTCVISQSVARTSVTFVKKRPAYQVLSVVEKVTACTALQSIQAL